MTGGDCEGSSEVEAGVPARDVACVGNSGSWLYQSAPLRRFDGTDAVGWGNERERKASCCSPRSTHRAVYQEGEHLNIAGSYSSELHCIISVGPALFCSCPHWFLPNKALISLTVHSCQRWCATRCAYRYCNYCCTRARLSTRKGPVTEPPLEVSCGGTR